MKRGYREALSAIGIGTLIAIAIGGLYWLFGFRGR